MTTTLTTEQLMGREESHLITAADGHRLHPEAAAAFAALKADAAEAGFELIIASSFRSFERQCEIWCGKAEGDRPIHDDSGAILNSEDLSEAQRLHAILRFSALLGTSRHHWGTDMDVFDARMIPDGYPLQLSPAEVATGGMFDPLHCWLDEQMAAGQSHGFFRPYAIDRGGVAPERWHLSYAPLATACEAKCYRAELESALIAENISLGRLIQQDLKALLSRYVAVPEGWCPARYRSP